MEHTRRSMKDKNLNNIAATEKAIAEKYGDEAIVNPNSNWTVCGTFPKKSMDDVCITKFDCCHGCYIKYVDDREERWLKGWRPKNANK